MRLGHPRGIRINTGCRFDVLHPIHHRCFFTHAASIAVRAQGLNCLPAIREWYLAFDHVQPQGANVYRQKKLGTGPRQA
jgi:hypothetical protein